MGRAFEVRKASMAKTAAAKAKVYSRFGKEIYVAAKAGVPDPEMNTTLKHVIEKARANQVPSDVIKRAIEKAKGKQDESYASITYEGFGSGDATILVECLTDNTNRSLSDVRACFNKSHAKLGVAGAVSHSYTNTGMLVFSYDKDEDSMLELLLEADVDVFEIEKEEDLISVNVAPTDLHKARLAIEEVYPDVKFEVLETEMIPNEYVTLEGEDLVLFERLLNLLDEVDDVQKVYHNVNL